jgi:hypothetical protein
MLLLQGKRKAPGISPRWGRMDEKMTTDRDYPKYVYCSIKNIAVLNLIEAKKINLVPHLSLLNTLPNNCIRMNSAQGWCYTSGIDAVCQECKRK